MAKEREELKRFTEMIDFFFEAAYNFMKVAYHFHKFHL